VHALARSAIYFLRSISGQRPVPFEGAAYPLHLSTPGMRFIAELPAETALSLLQRSRDRFGWPRSVASVPRDESDAVATASSLVRHDCIVGSGWGGPSLVSAAILLRPYKANLLALTLNGPREAATDDELRLLLHEFRRHVEKTLDRND
jgi:hypothetical protein